MRVSSLKSLIIFYLFIILSSFNCYKSYAKPNKQYYKVEFLDLNGKKISKLKQKVLKGTQAVDPYVLEPKAVEKILKNDKIVSKWCIADKKMPTKRVWNFDKDKVNTNITLIATANDPANKFCSVIFLNNRKERIPQLFLDKVKYKSLIKNPYEVNKEIVESLMPNKIINNWVIVKNGHPTSEMWDFSKSRISGNLVLMPSMIGISEKTFTVKFVDSKGKLIPELTQTGIKYGNLCKDPSYINRRIVDLLNPGRTVRWHIFNNGVPSERNWNFVQNGVTQDITLIALSGDNDYNFKCFAECTWDEIINVIHGKTFAGVPVKEFESCPTGYARVMFDNVNAPQLYGANREGNPGNVKTFHNCFASGCQKKVHIYGNDMMEDNYYVHIIGFDHDPLASDPNKKAPITLQMVGSLGVGFRMNQFNINNGGWKTSELRNSILKSDDLNSSYIPTPADGSKHFKLAKVLKGCDTGTIIEGGKSKPIGFETSEDYIFLLSMYELMGCYDYKGHTKEFLSSNKENRSYFWLDDTCELNRDARHFTPENSRTPKMSYFLRDKVNHESNCPWYSRRWNQDRKMYEIVARGSFLGDRQGFVGFTGNREDTFYYDSDNVIRNQNFLTYNVWNWNTIPAGDKQYEYWDRFMVEHPSSDGVSSLHICRYKHYSGGVVNYLDRGALSNNYYNTYLKPSWNKTYSFSDGNRLVCDVWFLRSSATNSPSFFCCMFSENSSGGYSKADNFNGISLAFCLE